METTLNRTYGEFFGYPSCCITAFGDIAIPFFKRPAISRAAKMNGFIPCPNCAVKLKTKQVTYQELINPNRKCSIPFKEEYTDEEELQIQRELQEL